MNDTLLQFIETLDTSMKQYLAVHNAAFSELTLHQMQYLEAIATLNDPTISEIADHMGFSKPSVTVAMKKLVKLGYARKQRSQEDQRMVIVQLTESGEKFKNAKQQTLAAYEDFIITSLTQQESEQFEAILNKLVMAFDEQNHLGGNPQ